MLPKSVVMNGESTLTQSQSQQLQGSLLCRGSESACSNAAVECS